MHAFAVISTDRVQNHDHLNLCITWFNFYHQVFKYRVLTEGRGSWEDNIWFKHNITQYSMTFIDTQVQAIQYILESTLSKSVSCVMSQSWLYALCDTLSICDGEQQITTRKETKAMKYKENIINEINWFEKEKVNPWRRWLFFIVMHGKYKCKNLFS